MIRCPFAFLALGSAYNVGGHYLETENRDSARGSKSAIHIPSFCCQYYAWSLQEIQYSVSDMHPHVQYSLQGMSCTE